MSHGQIARPSFRGSLKALEADINHANTLADSIKGGHGGACLQMKLSCSPLAPIFVYLMELLDCSFSYTFSNYFGLFQILVYKVYADGKTSISTYERKASIKDFYAVIFPSLQQLESNLMVRGETTVSSRKRAEELKKLTDVDLDRDDECGICLDVCTKMVLPNCNHSMCIKCFRGWNVRSQSCPFCRGGLKRVSSRDLWVLTTDSDIIDTNALQKDDVRRFYRYIDTLPQIVPDTLFLVFYDYIM